MGGRDLALLHPHMAIVVPPPFPLLPRSTGPPPIDDDQVLVQGGRPILEAAHIDGVSLTCLHNYPHAFNGMAMTCDGGEPIANPDIAYRLHQWFEDTETMLCHCEQCAPAVATAPPPVMGCDGWLDSQRAGGEGVRPWRGQTRCVVYAQLFGGPALNLEPAACIASEFLDVATSTGAQPGALPRTVARAVPLVVPSSVSTTAGGGGVIGAAAGADAGGVLGDPGCPGVSDGGGGGAVVSTIGAVIAEEVLEEMGDSLLFDAGFESGNLKRAERVVSFVVCVLPGHPVPAANPDATTTPSSLSRPRPTL